MDKTMHNPLVHALYDADCIIESDGATYVAYADMNLADLSDDADDIEDQAIWKIKKYTETTVADVKTTKLGYPYGSTSYKHVLTDYEDYEYSYAI